MNGYIARSACRGRRPSSLAAAEVRERSSLFGKLLKDRGVARYIVAPDGYGKSYLALGYAEMMFEWLHTFWLNAQSPCFIRDLDQRVIASSCLAYDEQAGLVVFEDVPPLDPERSELFAQEVDTLLSQGCEVIVTCTPLSDTSGGFQLDRIRIGAQEMLLTDEEFDRICDSDEGIRRSSTPLDPGMRVPGLAWCADVGAGGVFARAAFGEEMPVDLMLLMASVLVLREGELDELPLPAGMVDGNLLDALQRDYPHLGIDAELGRFQAVELSPDDLEAPLGRHLAAMAGKSSCETVERLVDRWAETLLRAGSASRACDVVRVAYPRRQRAGWLFAHAVELLRQACFLPTLLLVSSQSGCRGDDRSRINAVEALCLHALGDERGALKHASSVAFGEGTPEDAHVCCLLLVAHFGAGPLANRAQQELERLTRGAQTDRPNSTSPWLLLAAAWVARLKGVFELGVLWEGYRDGGVADDVLCLCASWFFALLEGGRDESMALMPAQRSCERYVRARLAAEDAVDLDYFTASAGLAMEEAHRRGVPYEAGPLEAAQLLRLRQVEMRVLAQRGAFAARENSVQRQREDWAVTHPDALARARTDMHVSRRRSAVPMLSIRLFGNFDVAIGEEPVDKRLFNRHNSRALLVLLAASRGKEVSREAVERAMWPESTAKSAHKNFYTVWSSLRRALTLPDGTCPYLVRHQYGCSLESRYVESDVARFDDICRELLFGVPNPERWPVLFSEIDRDFSGELMPSERKNRLVVQVRQDYCNRLVDALVSASTGIIETSAPQWGIWFARAALEHDETREDAYVALMRAQIASNQRTAAMMTYLKCRRVLAERLGIDPSPESTELYESLLDSD